MSYKTLFSLTTRDVDIETKSPVEEGNLRLNFHLQYNQICVPPIPPQNACWTETAPYAHSFIQLIEKINFPNWTLSPHLEKSTGCS